MAELAFLNVSGRRIAYRLRAGGRPTLLFLPGYASDMEGTKALALDAYAMERGLGILRFDYSGTGSSAGKFADGTLAIWLEDALAVIDQLTTGPLILIGSSMGGWIALHLALLRPERAEAFIGIAAAPDFTEWGFSAEQQKSLISRAQIEETNTPGQEQGYITREFFESGQSLLLLGKEIAVDCKVRLVHGECDEDVPLQIAFQAMSAIRSGDVQLIVVKGGGHRLSEPNEIETILQTVNALLEPVL